METIPTTSHSLDHYYHINGDTFEKQYKELLSGYREWSELSHAEEWLIFPENMGESICIDETAPSNGELYTVVSNRASRGGRGTIIAMVKGVISDTVIDVLLRIDEEKRLMVKEITMDMSNSMHLIAKRCFPNALRAIDRFHIQKLSCDALQEMRIAHRWDAIQADTDAGKEAKAQGKTYRPVVLENGEIKHFLPSHPRAQETWSTPLLRITLTQIHIYQIKRNRSLFAKRRQKAYIGLVIYIRRAHMDGKHLYLRSQDTLLPR